VKQQLKLFIFFGKSNERKKYVNTQLLLDFVETIPKRKSEAQRKAKIHTSLV